VKDRVPALGLHGLLEGSHVLGLADQLERLHALVAHLLDEAAPAGLAQRPVLLVEDDVEAIFSAISTIWAWTVEGPSRLTHRTPSLSASGGAWQPAVAGRGELVHGLGTGWTWRSATGPGA
jgi:hypothetical protein